MRLKSYLSEEVLALTREEAVDRLASGDYSQILAMYKKRKARLYRGMSGGTSSVHSYMLMHNRADRVPQGNRYMWAICKQLPAWKHFPDRSKSIFCSSDRDEAGLFSDYQIFIVFPENGAKFGKCHGDWNIDDAFNHGVGKLDSTFGIVKFESLVRILSKLYYHGKDPGEKGLFDLYADVALSVIDKKIKSVDLVKFTADHALTPVQEAILMVFKSKYKQSVIQIFAELFDPVSNDIVIEKLPQLDIAEKNAHEFWTADRCIVVSIDEARYLFTDLEDAISGR